MLTMFMQILTASTAESFPVNTDADLLLDRGELSILPCPTVTPPQYPSGMGVAVAMAKGKVQQYANMISLNKSEVEEFLEANNLPQKLAWGVVIVLQNRFKLIVKLSNINIPMLTQESKTATLFAIIHVLCEIEWLENQYLFSIQYIKDSFRGFEGDLSESLQRVENFIEFLDSKYIFKIYEELKRDSQYEKFKPFLDRIKVSREKHKINKVMRFKISYSYKEREEAFREKAFRYVQNIEQIDAMVRRRKTQELGDPVYCKEDNVDEILGNFVGNPLSEIYEHHKDLEQAYELALNDLSQKAFKPPMQRVKKKKVSEGEDQPSAAGPVETYDTTKPRVPSAQQNLEEELSESQRVTSSSHAMSGAACGPATLVLQTSPETTEEIIRLSNDFGDTLSEIFSNLQANIPGMKIEPTRHGLMIKIPAISPEYPLPECVLVHRPHAASLGVPANPFFKQDIKRALETAGWIRS